MKPFCLYILVIAYFSGSAQIPADLLIKNGRIIDGTGNSWFWGDVAVTGGKISYVGKTSSITAKKSLHINKTPM